MEHSFEQENNMPIYEGILLLDAPRIMQAPMDPILMIDFVIRNFYHYETHKKFTDERGYQNIIKAAQNRFWKPYYLAIAKHWVQINESFDASDWANSETTLSVSYLPFLNPSIQNNLNTIEP